MDNIKAIMMKMEKSEDKKEMKYEGKKSKSKKKC